MGGFGLLVPILLVAMGATAVGAVLNFLADALGWFSLARHGERPTLSRFFAGWPLILWGAASVLLPDLVWRLGSLVIFAEHAALTFLWSRPRGSVVAVQDGAAMSERE